MLPRNDESVSRSLPRPLKVELSIPLSKLGHGALRSWDPTYVSTVTVAAGARMRVAGEAS